MKICIISIGRMKTAPAKALVADYLGRIRHYFPIEHVEVRDEKQALAKVEGADLLVVLDERGREHTSVKFAEILRDLRDRGTKRIVFLVGDAAGLTEETRKKAGVMLALSTMTLQHEMALALLCEQLYRAGTILRGEPYHK